MFRNLAEGWNWPPEVVERLTPDQLVRLSSDAAKNPSAGGQVSIAHPSQLEHYRKVWMAWNSDEARLRRAEKMLARYTSDE